MEKTLKALSPKQVSALYPICEGSLGNMRCQKTGPRFFKVGRRVVYRPEDVEQWLFGSPVLTLDSARPRRRRFIDEG